MRQEADRLKEHLFGELPQPEARALEAQLAGDTALREEWECLQLTQALLRGLPDVEPPRRIAFVSDKVLTPRWWQLWRQPSPRWGFASAAMLSAALLVHAAMVRTGPAQTTPDAAAVQKLVQQQVAAQVATEVSRRTADLERVFLERERRREGELVRVLDAKLESVKRQNELDQRMLRVGLAEQFEVMQKVNGSYIKASNDLMETRQ